MHVIGPKNVLCMSAQNDKSMTSHWLLEDRERSSKKENYFSWFYLPSRNSVMKNFKESYSNGNLSFKTSEWKFTNFAWTKWLRIHCHGC